MRTLEYTLTQDDYLAFNQYAAGVEPALVRQSLRIRMIGTVAVAFALGLSLRLLDANALVTLIGTLLGVAVMWFSWPLVQRATTTAQLRRIAATSGLGRTGPTTLAWDDAGVTESAVASRASIGWDRLVRVGETGEHVFLFFGATEGLIVPKRAGSEAVALARYCEQLLTARAR